MASLLTEEDRKSVVDLLAELVAIPSANRGLAQAQADQPERQIADFVAGYLREMGMAVEMPEVYPGRPNVIGHWRDQGGRRRLVLEAHLDTVGTDAMTVDPFKPVQRDGRMYGRGACDTKGSMAAFLTALRVARRRGIKPADEIYFLGCMGEETGCHGARALVEAGFKCDGAIVGEPTGCHVATAHRGSLWLRVRTHGRACHASTPELGRNAIVAAAGVLDVLESRFKPTLQADRHELLGRATMSVGVINGGTKVNVVPDTCQMEIDMRLLPEQQPDKIVEQIRHLLSEHMPDWAENIDVAQVWSLPCMMTEADRPLVKNVLAVASARTNQDKLLAMSGFADSGPLHQSGADAIIFGPGSADQAHTADEFIELDQLFMATEIILELLARHQDRSVLG